MISALTAHPGDPQTSEEFTKASQRRADLCRQQGSRKTLRGTDQNISSKCTKELKPTVGLPWRLSGKESTCQCRHTVSIPCLEDPTCHRASKPMHHNCWACALESEPWNSRSLWALEPRSATREAIRMRSLRPAHTHPLTPLRPPQLEKSPYSNKDQVQPEGNK